MMPMPSLTSHTSQSVGGQHQPSQTQTTQTPTLTLHQLTAAQHTSIQPPPELRRSERTRKPSDTAQQIDSGEFTTVADEHNHVFNDGCDDLIATAIAHA